MNDWNRAIQMSAGNAVQNSMRFLGGMAEAYQYSAKVQDTIFMASKIAGATAEQQTEIMQLAQAVNAVTPLTAADIASGQRYLAMAGNTVEQIKDMTGPAAKLASILGQPLGGKGGVADLMTNIMSMYVIPSQQATKVTDDLYTAVTNANMSLTDLAQAITYAGADMANAGYDLRQTAAAIGVLGDMGIQGSSAGTALANMIRYLQLSLANQKKKGFSALTSLGLSPQDFFDAEGNLIRLDKVYRKFGEALMNKPLLERTKAFYNIFGVRGTRDISNQIRNMMAGSDKMTKILEQYDKNSGIVEQVTEERLKTPQGIIEAFKSNFENLVVNIGSTLADVFNPILTVFTKISQWVQGIAGTIGGQIVVKALAWGSITALVVNGYRYLAATGRMLSTYMQQTNTQSQATASGVSKSAAAAAVLETRLIHITQIMREQYYLQKAMAFGWTAGPREGWYGPDGKRIRKFGIPGPTLGGLGGGTTKPPTPTAGPAVARLGMKGLFGRLAGFLGGPWGMAIGIALPLVADYLPRLIDSLNKNTDSNLSKETLTSDEYLTEKMARAIRAALLNDKPNGTVNITIDGAPVGSVAPGETLGVNYATQIGLIP
ncbi:phage tail tape measure protein [Cetobacterium somerae]|uniref:phage tail tape measure protein n=2 Tax=Bacteria TaxID=2 RepID=UPI00248E1C73|nr:phage tail tape measure protein [Cetobacterium somerae]